MGEDWKEWHRRLSDILGCEYLERTVTLERAQQVVDRLATLEREHEQLRDVIRALADAVEPLLADVELDPQDNPIREALSNARALLREVGE